MTDVTGTYSGRPAFYLLLRVVGNAPSGSWELYAINPSGGTSFALDCFTWNVSISGNGWSGCHNLDFRGGPGQILLASGSAPLAAGANPIAASHGPASIFGSASASGSHSAASSATVPPPPTFYFDASPNPDQITPTTMRIRFSSTGDGGSPVTSWGFQGALSEDFTVSPSSIFGSSGTSTVTGLPPDTDVWFRARGQNAVGVGAWSVPRMGHTLPLLAPGVAVTPSLDGSAATLQLTSPPQATPIRYNVERRPVGGATTAFDTTSTTVPVTGLTPGQAYEWRSRAVVGTYVGDRAGQWSGWNLVSQPNPNTNPGDYFDGATADTPDVDFVWSGTANNSTSKAQGRRATGWRSFDDGRGASGLPAGGGVQVRVTGGRSGVFASRVTFFADASAAGFIGGTSQDATGRQDAAEGGVYWGSVYVQPSRAQRMAARIVWLNAAGVAIGAPVIGAAQVVPAGPGMTRLVVQGTAPALTEWMSVGWVDVAGAGHSLWRGGESVLQDDAMSSIGELIEWFSGDTPNTALFAYAWEGAPNASESSRTTLDTDDFDPLADPDCPPIPAAPQPPAIIDDCIEEVGTWRRYWAIIPSDQITDWLDLVPTITITTGAIAARQVRIRVYPNPFEEDPDDFDASTWEAEQIVSYIPPLTALTIDGVAQRVWAEVDGAGAIAADRLLYGTGGGPATWPVLSCGTAYLVSFDVPLDAPEGNLSVDVALTTRML